MRLLLIALVLVLVLLVLWLLAIKPGKITEETRQTMQPYENEFIAHRGFFNNKKSPAGEAPAAPENSMAAFRLAVKNGYGIELDLQLTSDGKLVVFHDATLKRMCGVKKNLYDCTFEELQRYPLLESDQRIPLFKDVLELVDGKVPLLVEVKPEGDCCKTAAALKEHMKYYKGLYIMESFHPKAVHWYAKNCPEIVRGQLAEHFPRKKSLHKNIAQFFLTNMMFNFWAKPQFIAYKNKDKNVLSYRMIRKLYPVFNVGWTIRDFDQLEDANTVFSVVVFDSFLPGHKFN